MDKLYLVYNFLKEKLKLEFKLIFPKTEWKDSGPEVTNHWDT